MSTAYILIVFAITIVLMIVLISKFKVHAAIGILLASLVLAIALKTPWQDIESAVNTGFAGTIESVGIVIFLGCVLGIVLEKTGAALRITKTAISKFGKKRIIWAIAFSSFILGIPIWADTVVILLIPIVSTIALQTGMSMMALGSTLYLGALVTASLVPPTPGPVAAAALLGLPLGTAIMWGLLIAIPSVIAATIYTSRLKEPVLPKEEYIALAEQNENLKLPSFIASVAPILLPLVLIVVNTAITATAPGSTLANVFSFFGSPLAALLAGCLLSLALTGPAWKTKKVLNDWVDNGITAAAMPIIVTGMGGVLAGFVRSSGVADKISELIVSVGIPGILVPIVIACLIHVVTGSNSLGVMTAASLVQPMLTGLGITPLAAFLACGTGALMFKHANSSGFWVTVTMSNMNINQGIRSVSIASTIAGGIGAIITVILSMSGII